MFKHNSHSSQVKRFIKWLSHYKYFCIFLATFILLVEVRSVAAQDTSASDFNAIDTIWLLVAAALVFFMNSGFALLEAGFCRTSNAVNVLAKNLIVFCVSALAFYLFGFSIMFADGFNYVCTEGQANEGLISGFGWIHHFPTFLEYPRSNAPLGFPDFGFSCLSQQWPNRSLASIFFFQLAFAGTAATIVSGAVAERVRFWAFFLFSLVLVGFLYPFTGHWVWSAYGWLGQSLHFIDFAGSTVVHTVGGTAALVGAWILKPRWNRFDYDPQEDLDETEKRAIPDKFKEQTDITEWSNPGFATLGCLILWLGWLGFNGGSTTDLKLVGHIITTTVMAAAAGGIVAIISTQSPLLQGSKARLSSLINGILGGLVGITASSAYVGVTTAVVIGAVSGITVIVGEVLLERWKIDDPVGAIPVHLFCGLVGTLAVCFSSLDYSIVYQSETFEGKVLFFWELSQNNVALQFLAQLVGWSIVFIVTCLGSLLFWIFIGCFLYSLAQANSTAQELAKKGKWWEKIIRQARQGIRVSIEEEEKGSDGFFDNQSFGEKELESKIIRVLNRKNGSNR
jgi:Amt family ammonium transporter